MGGFLRVSTHLIQPWSDSSQTTAVQIHADLLFLRFAEPSCETGGNSICGPGPFSFRHGHAESQCNSLHFRTNYPGGAPFVLADGSPKFIRYESAEVLPELASRNGGEVFEMP